MRAIKYSACGFTVVELMVTLLIASILSATLGVSFVHLLTIQEKEREDAYVREKLADICSDYAEMLSVGSSFATNSLGVITAVYPKEAGGVSLEYGGNYETGIVVRVCSLTSSVQKVSATYGLVDKNRSSTSMQVIACDVLALDANGLYYGKNLPRMNADAELVPVENCTIQSCRLTPLKTNGWDCASLGLLEVTISYYYKDKQRQSMPNTATARRVVRLWNGD